jgi:hypothetical protein
MFDVLPGLVRRGPGGAQGPAPGSYRERLSTPDFADSGNNPAQHETGLKICFRAAYLMTTDKRGVPALLFSASEQRDVFR